MQDDAMHSRLVEELKRAEREAAEASQRAHANPGDQALADEMWKANDRLGRAKHALAKHTTQTD